MIFLLFLPHLAIIILMIWIFVVAPELQRRQQEATLRPYIEAVNQSLAVQRMMYEEQRINALGLDRP